MAEITTGVDVLTLPVVIANAAETPPAGTVTEGGTVAVAFCEAKATAAPPAGAGPFNVTVPLLSPPLPTEAGDSVSDASATGATVIVAVAVAPP